MAMVRVSITVPIALLAKARRAVRTGKASSISAFFREAIMEAQRREELAEELDNLRAPPASKLTSSASA